MYVRRSMEMAWGVAVMGLLHVSAQNARIPIECQKAGCGPVHPSAEKAGPKYLQGAVVGRSARLADLPRIRALLPGLDSAL
ncbi:hypothetical protein GCM10010329_78010 [Streptomyces spiroverticillatus]|uniref:Uncharacterized protein n=1 Tax=Streptomyces finlayi TaxID=67296 RepID=A0A918X586_9ACTN|nr:hypothetical protein GCM10010329_78010 [Streptomyces spiroverticillatus]GHD13331.1 hypothetical protein GCM10010334_71340 [Streptomyces finlayi]